MKGFLLFMGLLALVYADERQEEKLLEESMPKAECSRMMCRMFCPLGFHLNDDGCPECRCIEDPCQELDCEGSDVCRPVSQCTEFPCRTMKAECIASMPCPMPMCANMCPNGYKTNAHGCMSCDCAEAETDLCAFHPCTMMHECIMAVSPLCTGGDCKKQPTCIPDGLQDMFLPQNVEDEIEKVAPFIPHDVPEALDSVCQFRKGFAEKLSQETKTKYANHSMLSRILMHEAMHNPWCTEDGKFKPMQCHAPDRSCWCVNDRGHQIPDSKALIKTKEDLPQCMEHITTMIEGSFTMAHQLDNVESHLEKIASVVRDHMAAWMKIDAAQIVIHKVTTSESGMILIQFSLHRTDTNELSNAELQLGWHLSQPHSSMPYEGTTLIPQSDSLKMEHTTKMMDDEMNPELPEHGFMSFYHHHKVAVICGGVGILIFLAVLIAIVVTVCKRGRVTSSQFKHKRMNDKSKTYKENLAFANEIYGKQAEKPGVEEEATEEKEATEEDKKEEPEATEA